MSFYSEIVKYYEAIFPLKQPKEEFVRKIILGNSYDSLLDIGCATGALCGSMAKHLETVRGFDLDEAMVKRANMFYKYNNIDFKPGDMLKLDELYPEERFDMITCFGNTLVHVGKSNVAELFQSVARHLDDKGTFVLQILNYDYVLNEKIDVLPLIDNQVIRFDRYYENVSEEVLDFRTVLTVKETGEELENSIPLYPIHKSEVDGWLRDAGFDDITYYKNYNSEPYDGEHLPLILIAKKQ